ncbi:MAG: hypothetical protein LBH76_03435 [Propionibacteriaceae bacterium]|nr:hypothetical protein [Propionibacteriaceae bacterium]
MLRFATRDAQKGWADLVATAPNASVAAWEFLAETPTAEDGRVCYRLAGRLGRWRVDGQERDRWQCKPTGGGRIWYAVVPATGKIRGVVFLERVSTGHPNETIKRHR